ncbi:MAG: HEAT repeat domain-containing protein [Rhodothermales bacterium]|nr:HEAT repeat domain-containing protein [Rhodothermales bacterium]
MKAVIFVCALLVLPVSGIAQEVARYGGTSTELETRWTWAENELDRRSGDIWFGYSIERLMRADSHMGRYSSRKNYPTFGELLYGIKTERTPGLDSRSDRMIMKEMVMMFLMSKQGKIQDVLFSTLDGDVHVDNDILWLGNVDTGASLANTKILFRNSTESDVREDLVAAISMHDSPEALDMLRSILKADDVPEVREQAAFWMSQVSDTEVVLDDLVSAATNDQSEDVQEQAVFAISQIETKSATDALIRLARTGPSEIKDESIFWLGQKATDRATESLAEIVENDPDYEVKKQALFALSQQENQAGIDMLIQIARTHDSAALRKDAIFWLSQSDDPAALDAIVAIVKG